MKIKSVRIKNFRAIDDITVDFDPYTSLVGPNGAGKSTVLCALNIFFREAEGVSTSVTDLDAEDFHNKNTAEPIEITVTFDDLSEDARADFAEYFRQGVLTITAKAVFDAASNVARVEQFGQRLAMAAFVPFFEAYNSGQPAGECKNRYQEIKEHYPDLPTAGSKDANRDALRAYEETHPEACTLIPSEDQFYGFSKGSNRLAKYVQWVYVPAVKDATKENVEAKNNAIGRLLARTVRSKVEFAEDIKALQQEAREQYRKLIEAQQGSLNEISESLSKRLAQWAHPDVSARLEWSEDPKRSVQIEEPLARLLAMEGEFEGELARFGHGLQRSYLLALLQELATSDDDSAPLLILGCEEPELYQHPPQARHLADVFQQLADANAQIVVSTHSPYFVTGRYFESLRLVRRDHGAKRSTISAVSFDAIAERVAAVSGEAPVKADAQMARLHQALQPHLNEMFFAPKVVFVEGLEDAAYINAWMMLSGCWDAFRQFGVHVVPVNGKSFLIEPVVVADFLNIPSFTIFDADGNKTNATERKRHEIDNVALLRLLGGDDSKPFPDHTVWGDRFVQWPDNLGKTLRSEMDQALWDSTFGHVRKGLGDPEGSYAKNPVFIGMHLELLMQKGEVPTSLHKLCEMIVEFGRSA